MIFKIPLLIFVVLVQIVVIKSECDDYFTCFGDFIKDFFNYDNNNNTVTKTSEVNVSTNYFDVSDFEKQIDEVVGNVSRFIQDQVDDELKIESQQFVHNFDKTKILIKTFNIEGKVKDNLFNENYEFTTISPDMETTINFNTDSPIKTDSDLNETIPINITSRYYLPVINVTENKSLIQDETKITTTTKNFERATENVISDKIIENKTMSIETRTQESEIKITATQPSIITKTSKEPKNKTEDISVPEINIQDNEITNSINTFDDVIFDNEFNITDYPNYLEIYKDTTNEDVEYIPTEVPTSTEAGLSNEFHNNIIEYTFDSGIHDEEDLGDYSVQKCSSNDTSDAKDVIFPWIAAIFVKVNNSEQFDYYCDGALISNTVVVTAARCVWSATAAAATSVDDVLVILGKTSLQAVANSEKVLRVKKIKIHEDFKMADSEIINDLAVLNLEEPVKFGKSIRPACLYNDTSGSGNDTSENGNDTSWTDCDDALTTGWRVSGELTQIHFEKEKSKDCKDTGATFCAVYGNDITVCPSHAGLFIVRRQKTWYLKGLRSSDPTNKGICFERTVWYTSLEDHYTWIQEYD